MIYVFAFGMQHTHPLGLTLPLNFTNPQAFATYEYNQDKQMQDGVGHMI